MCSTSEDSEDKCVEGTNSPGKRPEVVDLTLNSTQSPDARYYSKHIDSFFARR